MDWNFAAGGDFFDDEFSRSPKRVPWGIRRNRWAEQGVLSTASLMEGVKWVR